MTRSSSLLLTTATLSLLAPASLSMRYPVTGAAAPTTWQGRYLASDDGSASFDWPGVRVSFTTSAETTTVSAEILSPGAVRGLFRMAVDGVNTTSIATSNASATYVLASGLAGARTVELYSILEPALLHPQPFLPEAPYTALSLVSLTADGALGAPPPAPKRRLLFFGDR